MSLIPDARMGLRASGFEPRTLGMLGVLVVSWIAFDLASDGLFLTPRNLYNLAVQSSVVGVMACAMVFVITARHIDLSVGSVLGFTGMLIAALQAEWLPADAAWSWPLACAVGIAVGAAIGAFQGFWVAYRGVPAFVVTLAGLLIFRGAAYLVTDGRTVAPLAEGFQALGGGLSGSLGAGPSWALAAVASAFLLASTLRGRRLRSEHGFDLLPFWVDASRVVVGAAAIVAFVSVMVSYTHPQSHAARGIPVPVLIWLAAAAGLALLFRRTRFGRWVTALGGNPAAVVRAGVNVDRTTLFVFVLMGVLSAVGAIITTARLGAGANSMGTLLELSVIAAAVIGGTSLSGGRGSVAGAALGAVLMQTLDNGMVLLGVSSAVRQISIGAVLLVAVWIDSALRARGAQR